MHDGTEWDSSLGSVAAELTVAAYPVALQQGLAGSWVDLEIELWIIVRLLEPDINQARHLTQLPEKTEAELLGFSRVRSHDLHVDGGWSPEIQDLAHDIGGGNENTVPGKSCANRTRNAST